jgi:hypothetical protein
MEHYDLRVIEDCLVFSYEVECPNYPKETVSAPTKKMPSRRERRKEKQISEMKKMLLRILLCALMPFALLADAMLELARFFVSSLKVCLRSGMKYAPALGTFSCFVILTALLHIL